MRNYGERSQRTRASLAASSQLAAEVLGAPLETSEQPSALRKNTATPVTNPDAALLVPMECLFPGQVLIWAQT